MTTNTTDTFIKLSATLLLFTLIFFVPIKINGQSTIESVRQKQFEYNPANEFEPFTIKRGASLRNIGPTDGKKQVLDLDPEFNKAILSKNKKDVRIKMPIFDEQIELKLKEVQILTDDFILRNGEGKEIVLQDKGRFYWGVVDGDENSVVAFSVFQNEISATIQSKAHTYTLAKIKGDESYMVFEEKDIEYTESRSCFTDEIKDYVEREYQRKPEQRAPNPNNCVQMYFEADNDLFNALGSIDNVKNYLLNAFSQVILLYDNENINIIIKEIKVWDTADPYTGPTTSNYLNQFKASVGSNFNGDLAHLVGTQGNGGIAYVNALCHFDKSFSTGYSGIYTTYKNVPTYSWTVEVLTHEIGHNLGSPHTHACSWNGNNTQIDDCGSKAGDVQSCYNSNNEIIPAKGTIMSYCHLISGVGIDFNLGFGPQPGDLVRSRVYNSNCLTECGSCELISQPCDDGDPCTINDQYDSYCNCAGVVVESNGNAGCADCNVTGVSIVTDNYPSETSWTLTNEGGSVIASGSGYNSVGQQDVFYICLEAGCYNFTINDSYGDGICCAYGSGSYSVTDLAGNILASGGSFGSSETTQFCYEASTACVEGTACDDGDPCTENDVYDADCGCAGTLIDADQDGICDNIDPCYDPMVIYLDQNISSGVYNAREQIILNPGVTVRNNVNIIFKAPFIKVMDDVMIPANADIQIESTPCQN